MEPDVGHVTSSLCGALLLGVSLEFVLPNRALASFAADIVERYPQLHSAQQGGLSRLGEAT